MTPDSFTGLLGQGSLQKIGWDEFFEKFDSEQLAFLYQVKTNGGRRSNSISPSRGSEVGSGSKNENCLREEHRPVILTGVDRGSISRLKFRSCEAMVVAHLFRLLAGLVVIVMVSALAWAICLIVAHWQRARPEPLEPI